LARLLGELQRSAVQLAPRQPGEARRDSRRFARRKRLEQEVEHALGVKIDFEIPSDRAVPLAVNRGVPAVLSDAGSDFSRAVRQMSKGLLQSTGEQKAKRRMFALARA